MIYGVTGASRPPAAFEAALAEALADLPAPAGFVTGSQVGVDEAFAEAALELYPEAQHLQIVPGEPGVHGRLLPGVARLYLPDGKDRASVYRARNERIVRESGVLLAFPEGPEESFPRSGTWMTVRIARKAGIPRWVFPLYDAEPWKEDHLA